MRIVDPDPFDALADILTLLNSTGVLLADGAITAAKLAADALTGAKFAPNWLAPEAFSNPVWHIGREIQLSETSTNLRTIMFPLGTAETMTIQVSKGGAALGASASVASQVAGNLGKLVIDASDIDTLGEVGWQIVGATNTQYISGVTVVAHDPQSDPNFMAKRLGKGLRRFDSALDTIETYDGPTTAYAKLNTETRTTSGTYTDWTSS
jgi:hypothetical protein